MTGQASGSPFLLEMKMPNGDFKCTEHSGCMAKITHLEKENGDQWTHMNEMSARINSIFTRLNIILGGVVVACILLAINIVTKAYIN